VNKKIEHTNSMLIKHRLVNDQIHIEYFYFNPVYTALLNKRTIMFQKRDAHLIDEDRVNAYL